MSVPLASCEILQLNRHTLCIDSAR